MKTKPETERAASNRMLFFTSDNRVFMDTINAEQHALTLQDSSITTMTKEAADRMTERLATDEDELEHLLDELAYDE